jgi:hypothetical protein
VDVPKKMTREQKDLFEKYAAAMGWT